MSKPKLTPWFPGSVNPRRAGLYEVRAGKNLRQIKWAVWKEGCWHLALPTRGRALRARCYSNDMLYGNALWRGLASEPKAA